MNAAFLGDAIRYFTRNHIGVAVALEHGLLTPLVRNADRKGFGLIICSGAGGYVAASRAARFGLGTVRIDQASLRGICLSHDCTPTKPLRRSAGIRQPARYLRSYDAVPACSYSCRAARRRNLAPWLSARAFTTKQPRFRGCALPSKRVV